MTLIRLKDFGPIAHASLELKPLTVFIGPNNTGKSYLALAIYCLSRTLSTDPDSDGLWTVRASSLRPSIFSRELRQRIRDQARAAWPNARSLPRQPMRVRDLPEGLREVLLEGSQVVANALASDFRLELERCYGTEISGLVRRGTALSAPQMEIALSEPESGFNWEMQARDGLITTNEWDSNLLEQEIDLRRSGLPSRVLIDEIAFFLLLGLVGGLDRTFASGIRPIGRAHYMPASRSGILLGHKTLASLIVGQASRAWVQPIEIPRLPGVITDLIQAILLWERSKPPDAKLQRVIAFLEGTVARGTVDMELETEYPEVYYETENGKFLLHQVSSMVSEVAPVVLYLKHLVRPGQLFIIEEPESHIDAENQRKLARAIAMLVNAKVRVLITTHSDFFVSQLNNLLLLSQLTPRRRAARKYSASEVLQPSEVGAYSFEPGADGSLVRTLEVTADGGIPTTPFTDAHSALYREAIALEQTSI